MKIDTNNINTKTGIFELSFIGNLENQENIAEDNIIAMQKQLAKAGVSLYYIINQNTAWFKFAASPNPRGAGRKKASLKTHLSEIEAILLFSKYKNTEIIELTGLSPSTYYRQKKKLLQSPLYMAIQADGNLKNIEKLSENIQKYVSDNGTTYIAKQFC